MVEHIYDQLEIIVVNGVQQSIVHSFKKGIDSYIPRFIGGTQVYLEVILGAGPWTFE